MDSCIRLPNNYFDDDDVDRWFDIKPPSVLVGIEFDVGSYEMYEGDCILLHGERCKARVVDAAK